MLNFTIDVETCIGCGQCSAVCPAMIINMESNLPEIPTDLEQFCIACMHCVAVCSEGSAAIHGYGPDEGQEITDDGMPTPQQMEFLIKSRRSTRSYQDKNVDTVIIDKLVEVASHAPTGHNDRSLLFTVVDDKGVIYDLREMAFAGLEKLIGEESLPEGMEMFADIMEAWKQEKKDILFRGAPHLLIVSAHKESAAPMHDCIIALTTFDLYAQSHGLGTIWNGLATLTIADLVPELKNRLGIPEDHRLGYAMGFGLPAIRFERTIERGVPAINKVRL